MKKHLMSPGPTPVPEDVLLTMAEPMVHHRTPDFIAKVGKAMEGLQYIFQTENDILIFSSSGTGAMEGAVANILNPADKALIIRNGKFAERWGEIAESFKTDPIYLDVDWGEICDPDEIKEILNENPDIKAVYTQLTETSTGVVMPIKELGEIIKDTDALLIVDAISGLAGQEFYMDKWNVDICVAGSQKGLMLPPGHAYAAVSDKAWKVIEKSEQPHYYFDWMTYKKKLVGSHKDPFTGSVVHVKGLLKVIDRIKSEGIENMFQRYKVLAEATQNAVKALGLDLFAKAPCDVETSVKIPESVDGKKLTKLMRDKYGFTIAGGQKHVKGKIIRIAHMGYIEAFDVISVIAGLEMVLKELGWDFKVGAGVAAAQQVISEKYKF